MEKNKIQSLKRIQFLMVFLAMVAGGIFAGSCSSAEDNKTCCQIVADNLTATVVDNDKGVTTEAFFTALNSKLQSSSGEYTGADGLEKAKKIADEAVSEFESTDMQGVYFYGRFAVNCLQKGSTEKVKLNEYANKQLGKDVLLKALAHIAAANPDGFTVNAITLEPVTKGYAVSLEATQNSFGTEGLARVIDYVTTHNDVNAYGGWLNTDNNQYYYDATVICTTREEAEALARQNHQIAYFDLENMEEIRL